MTTQLKALRLADELEEAAGAYWRFQKSTGYGAAAELRRLHAERAAADGVINDLVAKVRELQEANEAFGKRQEWWNEKMLTLEAQRDALLEALKDATKTIEHLGYPLAAIERARAAIKAVEETK